MPSHKVFLSHSSADKSFADRLAYDLGRVNVGVWYDKWEIRVGDSLIEKIAQGIEANDYLALILSPNSVASEWVKREVNAALMRELEEKKVIILPILIEECKIPSLLKEKKYADFRNSYEEGFEDFLFAVSPESDLTVRRSKNFRIVQYLLSGLASTDEDGTNTLNSTQLRRVYPYRRELQTFLGLEEKRLLFWSALAFSYSNPLKPSFMDITTPVWGLIDGTTSQQHATWIMDGLKGVLFDYLILHCSWAINVLGRIAIDSLKKAFLNRQNYQDNFLSTLGPIPLPSMRAFLILLAENDREMFDKYFLPHLKSDIANAASIIEATAYLSPPLEDDFYIKLSQTEKPLALAAVRALSKLRRPNAVTLLKSHIDAAKTKTSPDVNAAFSRLGYFEFVPHLQDWLEQEGSVEVRARLLVPLANANSADRQTVISTIEKLTDNPAKFELLPTLIRVYGRIGTDPEGHLFNWVKKWNPHSNPIICEAVIFALARVAGRNSLQVLSELLHSKSETILAATIEAMSKVAGIDVYDELSRYSNHKSNLVQSAFYRALINMRPPDWHKYVSQAKDRHPMLRLCAARSLAQLATPTELQDWLADQDLDNHFKVTADEILFAPSQFTPDWIANSKSFDSNLARYSVRLTNLDTEQVWLDTFLDIDRQMHIQFMRDLT